MWALCAGRASSSRRVTRSLPRRCCSRRGAPYGAARAARRVGRQQISPRCQRRWLASWRHRSTTYGVMRASPQGRALGTRGLVLMWALCWLAMVWQRPRVAEWQGARCLHCGSRRDGGPRPMTQRSLLESGAWQGIATSYILWGVETVFSCSRCLARSTSRGVCDAGGRCSLRRCCCRPRRGRRTDG